MKTSNVEVAAIAMAMLVLLLTTTSEAAISCSDVVKDLNPCITYLTKGTGSPTTACCTGVAKLASATKSSADKKAACACIKSTAAKLKPKDAAANALAGSCGISLAFTVSSTIDCSKIG